MGILLFTGGTVVTADGSFEADVLVEDEKIVAIGANISDEGVETVVDASGKLVMPGFIDAHTHMDMPFGGTTTADDWATGTAAAVAGGTTMIVDFALAEKGDVTSKLKEQALARGDPAPRFHALPRPEKVEAEATNRAIRLAEVAGAPILVVHVSCAAALEEVHRAHERGSIVYAETCPQYFAFSYSDLAREGFEGAKYVCSPPLRDESNRASLWNGLRVGDLQIVGSDHCSFNYREQKELGINDFTLIPNGLPGAEERAMALWTLGVQEGRLSENQFVSVLSTNQARIYGAYPRKGALVPGADADVVLWDPEMTATATAENRHGNVDYTPYEGMTFNGGPASVYVRGNLVYRDGEVVGEYGSGRFIERSFSAPALGAKV